MFTHKLEDLGASGKGRTLAISEWTTEDDLTSSEVRTLCNAEARPGRTIVLSTLVGRDWWPRFIVGYDESANKAADSLRRPHDDWRPVH